MEITTFHAPVFTAIVADPKAETGKRDAQYIPATCIPEDILVSLFGYGVENKRHPWNIRGMAWDFVAGGWRNMKNAEILPDGQPSSEIVFDITDSRTFFPA